MQACAVCFHIFLAVGPLDGDRAHVARASFRTYHLHRGYPIALTLPMFIPDRIHLQASESVFAFTCEKI